MTPNDLKTENFKTTTLCIMKASNPGNLKTDIEYIFDPLVTSNDPLMTPNDLKTKTSKNMALCISNER